MVKKILLAIATLFILAVPNNVEAYNGPDVEFTFTDKIPDVTVSLPIYGNWCGPGHGGKVAYSPMPIDKLDYGCMRHDLCYMKNGYFNANCDKELLNYIEINKPYMKQREKIAANAVYATFAISKLRK